MAFSYFSGLDSTLFEKESTPGGLLRPLEHNGISYDIGAHMLQSRKKEVIKLLQQLAPMQKLPRINRILHEGRRIKFPFESDLAELSAEDCHRCAHLFLKNPYSEYPATNMLMYFYKTFGEGITRSYLEPYNQKRWKFEPSFMDTQLVSRIPRPTSDQIINSAKGRKVETPKGQQFFYYPEKGGMNSLVISMLRRTGSRLQVKVGEPLEKLILKPGGIKEVKSRKSSMEFSHLVTTIPLFDLLRKISPKPPEEVMEAMERMQYNSIHITKIDTQGDSMGDIYSLLLPNPDISFHRVSRINYLGSAYGSQNGSSLLTEISFRAGDSLDLSSDYISEIVATDLERSNITSLKRITGIKTDTFKYAGVIYSIDHVSNMRIISDWLNSVGIISLGRFANFQYNNTDEAILQAYRAASKLLEREGIDRDIMPLQLSKE